MNDMLCKIDNKELASLSFEEFTECKSKKDILN
jgi:hypothetical protein